MPGVAVTCRHRFNASVTVVDGKVQSNHRVATRSIGVGVRRRIRRIRVIRVPPCEAVASRHRLNAGVTVVDGQLQGVRAVNVCVARVVSLAMPSILVASGDFGGGAIVDGEVQRCHRVAAHRVLSSVGGSVGRGCVLRPVPHIAVASRHRFNTCVAVVNGEVEGNDGVATGSIECREGRCVG